MGSIGTGEVLLVLVVALIVLGPDKLPKVARQVGSFMGDLRRFTSDIRNEVDAVINEAEKPVDETPEKKLHPGTEGFVFIDQQSAVGEDVLPEDRLLEDRLLEDRLLEDPAPETPVTTGEPSKPPEQREAD